MRTLRVVLLAVLTFGMSGIFFGRAAAAATGCTGKVLLTDNFAQLGRAWGRPDQTIAVMRHMLVLSPPASRLVGRLNHARLFKDFSLCAVAAVGKAADGRDPGAIAFWATGPRNYYLFAVNGLGRFAVLRMQDGKFSAVLPWKATSALKPGAGVWNVLQVTSRGKGATLAINGRRVAEITGEPPAAGGYIGFIAETTAKGPAQWAFGRLVVTDPDSVAGTAQVAKPAQVAKLPRGLHIAPGYVPKVIGTLPKLPAPWTYSDVGAGHISISASSSHGSVSGAKSAPHAPIPSSRLTIACKVVHEPSSKQDHRWGIYSISFSDPLTRSYSPGYGGDRMDLGIKVYSAASTDARHYMAAAWDLDPIDPNIQDFDPALGTDARGFINELLKHKAVTFYTTLLFQGMQTSATTTIDISRLNQALASLIYDCGPPSAKLPRRAAPNGLLSISRSQAHVSKLKLLPQPSSPFSSPGGPVQGPAANTGPPRPRPAAAPPKKVAAVPATIHWLSSYVAAQQAATASQGKLPIVAVFTGATNSKTITGNDLLAPFEDKAIFVLIDDRNHRGFMLEHMYGVRTFPTVLIIRLFLDKLENGRTKTRFTVVGNKAGGDAVAFIVHTLRSGTPRGHAAR